MLKTLHAVAGAVAFATLLSFWTATVTAEIFLDAAAVVAVKGAVVTGLLLLVPAMAVAGATGAALSKQCGGRLTAHKSQRMKILAVNGVLVMIPAALFLNAKAAVGELDQLFYLAQAVELTVGAGQMVLMALNIRDGLRLTGRLRRSASP